MTTTTKTRKSTKARPVKTEAQRAEAREAAQAKAKEAHERLAGQVETLATSEGWKMYLTAASRFHSYSFNNLMMIVAQMPEATQVAGFRKWQELGRTVRKGEKSLKIFGFSKKKDIDPATGEEVEKVFYPLLSVFDISQTDIVDPEKWAEVEAEQGSISSTITVLTGTEDHGMGDKMAALLESKGWEVVEEAMGGTQQGYARPADKRVAVRQGIAAAARAKTLAHETAHVLDGHTDDLAAYSQHRGRFEAIAESVAYLVGDYFGLDTSDYTVGYVNHWANGDVKLLKETAEAALRTFKLIIEGLDALEA